MKLPRPSTVLLGVALPVLILLTVLAWQFRFQESGTVYYQSQEFDSLDQNDQLRNYSLPEINTNQHLQFHTPDQNRCGFIRSWLVNDDRNIRINVKHRTVGNFPKKRDKQSFPLLVLISAYSKVSPHPLGGATIVDFSPPGSQWEVTEAVVTIPEDSHHVALTISTLSKSGHYEICELTVTGVEQRGWFNASGIILATAWTFWIFFSLRRSSAPSKSPLAISFATIWLVAWGSFLVFPRGFDIPRPFSDSFNTSSADLEKIASRHLQPAHQLQLKNKEVTPAPPPSRPWWMELYLWFKDQPAGGFVIHFGTMGLIAGLLFLAVPPRLGLPYILAMIVGGELVPYLWLGDFEPDDILDLSAYIIATFAAIPISRAIRAVIFTSPPAPTAS